MTEDVVIEAKNAEVEKVEEVEEEVMEEEEEVEEVEEVEKEEEEEEEEKKVEEKKVEEEEEHGDNKSGYWRVKLYQLEAEGAWQDQGTGGATYRNSEDGCPVIVVMNEDNTAVLLESKIKAEDIYEKQGESIIMWREPAYDFMTEVDYALSFQDSAGCMALWESIIAVQRQYLTQQEYGQAPSFSVSSSSSSSSSGALRNVKADGWTSPVTSGNLGSMATPSLPALSIATLSEVREKFVSMHSSQKDTYASLVIDQNGDYLRRLLSLFSDLEDLEDCENLAKIAEIFRSLMLLNDYTVLDLLVSDNLFLSVAGAMEFDPLLKTKSDFRVYLSGVVKRRDVPGAELTNPEQIAAIHKLFKLRFLRDSLARPCLEEMGSASIENAIIIASNDVSVKLFGDLSLLGRMLSVINPSSSLSDDVSKQTGPPASGHASQDDVKDSSKVDAAQMEKQATTASAADNNAARLDGLKFLRELFHLSRSLTYERRVDLYTRFCTGEGGRQSGLKTPFFSMCLEILANPDSPTAECTLVSEMLVCFSTVCPNIVRQIILQGPVPTFPRSLSAASRQQTVARAPDTNGAATLSLFQQNSQCLLWVFIQRIVMDSENAVIENMGDIIRVLLDPDRFERQEKDTFLSIFYDHYVYWFLVPFGEELDLDKGLPFGENWPSTRDIKQGTGQGPSALSTSRRVILDLMCTCVSGHSYRMKYFVMRNSAINLTLRLMKTSRHRHLQLSAVKFMRAIVASKDEFYFRHLVKFDLLRPIVEVLSRGKDDLITSVVLDLINFIVVEPVRTLISYLAEKFNDCFISPICAEIYEKLKVEYQRGRASEMDIESKNMVRQQRQQDRDNEDAYFYDDDGSSSTAVPAKMKRAEASEINPLAFLASAYKDVDGDVDFNKGHDQADVSGDDHQEDDSKVPPLPPLKAKYEVDDIPESFLRVRAKDSEGNGKGATKHDIASEVKSGGPGSVSFTMKKRKFT